MRILGVDPGTAKCGFGVIEKSQNSIKFIAGGVITTPPSQKLASRLLTIHAEVKEIISVHKPNEVAVEQLFFTKNVKTAMSVSHARGVILLAAAENKLRVFEYTPPQIKQATVGYGNAKKQQIQHMVARILKLKHIPKPDDAADALAVAICHSAVSQRIIGL